MYQGAADEIMHQMHQLVQPPDLNLVPQILDELNISSQLLEQAGLVSHASQVLQLLDSYASKNIVKLPDFKKLMQAGITAKDFQKFSEGDLLARAKINLALRQAGYNEHEIISFIGKHNYFTKQDAEDILNPERKISNIWKWIQNPEGDKELQPGQEIKMDSIAFYRAPDWHTQGLTPEKQVDNLLDHGTEFNMNFDMLQLDLNELELQHKDINLDSDFEDEI